ncbi:MAG: hypothetical protein AAGH92_08620 [Planctomycetota bacterium]
MTHDPGQHFESKRRRGGGGKKPDPELKKPAALPDVLPGEAGTPEFEPIEPEDYPEPIASQIRELRDEVDAADLPEIDHAEMDDPAPAALADTEMPDPPHAVPPGEPVDAPEAAGPEPLADADAVADGARPPAAAAEPSRSTSPFANRQGGMAGRPSWSRPKSGGVLGSRPSWMGPDPNASPSQPPVGEQAQPVEVDLTDEAADKVARRVFEMFTEGGG